ncbi:MAG: neutral zinc metallopeptidase [Cytophagales bacterium]|nr:neutral zinc metallopeptidase [Rhizobacter sp.]
MKWEGNRQSDNVEDARSSGGGRGFSLGGGRGIGLGTVAVALVAGWVFGINPLTVLGMLSGEGGVAPQTQQAPAQRPPADDKMAQFVSVVLADTEDVWREQFKQMGSTYREPKLRLFRGSEPTACGQGQAAMGPFYCPGDQKVYIDLTFYETMRNRLGAPGDFAQAYVIAHEVGHHVQNLMGITGKVDSMRGKGSEAQQNALSVRLELQADCFAGVWAHHAQNARQILEQGDVEEALNAASQIGDDSLQRKSRGTVQPETFTHGSSTQRVAWFKKGIQTGSVAQCNTFEARSF